MSALGIVIVAAGYMLGPDGWQTTTSTLFFSHVGLIWTGAIVHDPLHSIIARISTWRAFHIIIPSVTPHASSPTGTASLPLRMAGKRISSCKFAIALWAYMWALSSVQLHMAL